ncbi:MAG: hypothetical protein A3F78_05440 [Burkholderiales bacterium RIFCSPLOWO2_12_FULL_61_40]|nr:MAG: hypothetical protein A3F78_05440 [Burkholderiales bacterium RIFCSPLOWO2_12_FULL_61_40]
MRIAAVHEGVDQRLTNHPQGYGGFVVPLQVAFFQGKAFGQVAQVDACQSGGPLGANIGGPYGIEGVVEPNRGVGRALMAHYHCLRECELCTVG